VPLSPVSGYSNSIVLSISSDYKEAVGVSSNQTIDIDNTTRIITLHTGQTLVPTVWTIPATLPWVTWTSTAVVPPIVGIAFTGVTGNAALYGVSPQISSSFNYVGTKFGTSGATTGFISVGGTIDNFSTANSYGLGIGGPSGGTMGVGWYYNGTNNVPCALVTSAPGGTLPALITLSTSAGMAEACSSVGIGLTKYVEGSICGFTGTEASPTSAVWDIYYTSASGFSVDTFTGTASGHILYCLDGAFSTYNSSEAGTNSNYALGTDKYSVTMGSFAGTSTNTGFFPTAYGMVAASAPSGSPYTGMYVGINGGYAYEITLKDQWSADLQDALNGYHWGPSITTPTQNAIGIYGWVTSFGTTIPNMAAAYGIAVQPMTSSTYQYVVGSGHYIDYTTPLSPIDHPQWGYLVFHVAPGNSGGGGGGALRRRK